MWIFVCVKYSRSIFALISMFSKNVLVTVDKLYEIYTTWPTLTFLWEHIYVKFTFSVSLFPIESLMLNWQQFLWVFKTALPEIYSSVWTQMTHSKDKSINSLWFVTTLRRHGCVWHLFAQILAANWSFQDWPLFFVR